MKMIFSVILVVYMILTLPALTVFADVLETPYDITSSDVMTDLKRTYIDGVRFDEVEYPLNPEADYMLLLNVIEYAWADYGFSDHSPYGLYFYLYNPSGDKPLDPGMNQVQMSVAKDDFYVKYFLELVSASEDYRFLKFRITTPTTVYKRLWSVTRTYKISGIEIETKAAGVKEYKIAGTYTFTGTQAAKTLACQVDTLTTVSLEIGDTCYRTDTSSLGEFHRNQLDTVYFAIPNDLLKLYGHEIYKIRFEMEQKRICGIVTNSTEAYSSGVFPLLTGYISPSSFSDFSDNEHSESVNWCFTTDQLNYDWSWPYTWNAPGENRRDLLSYFGYMPFVDETMPPVEGDELLRYWDLYGFSDASCVGIIPKQIYEIDVDDDFDSVGYQTNHDFWETMLDYGFKSAFTGIFGVTDETIFTDVKPFQKLTLGMVDAHSSESFAGEYYVLENDYNAIRSYVMNAEENDATTYLFRFNTQDYFAIPGYLCEGVPSRLNDEVNAFYFEEYIYEDFDIMEIQLRDKKNVITVLPVVMSPVTIVPDIEAPITNPFEGEDGINPLSILLIVLAALVVIWVIGKILPKRVKVVNGRRRRKK